MHTSCVPSRRRRRRSSSLGCNCLSDVHGSVTHTLNTRVICTHNRVVCCVALCTAHMCID
jgi:hypothetical protein